MTAYETVAMLVRIKRAVDYKFVTLERTYSANIFAKVTRSVRLDVIIIKTLLV